MQQINLNWLVAIFLLTFHFSAHTQTNTPNVIVIITDDQGYGDLGFHGNPHVKTPVLDNFAAESTRFNNFYVSPVCAPTRSSLMTGRYSLRTGVRENYNENVKDQNHYYGYFLYQPNRIFCIKHNYSYSRSISLTSLSINDYQKYRT